jgi:hypothetical protein
MQQTCVKSADNFCSVDRKVTFFFKSQKCAITLVIRKVYTIFILPARLGTSTRAGPNVCAAILIFLLKVGGGFVVLLHVVIILLK